jgi:hypothetical protein
LLEEDGVDSLGDGRRPLTAPSIVGPSGAYPSTEIPSTDVLVESIECEDVYDDREEPEVILDKASTVLHDLQSRWADEREHEIRQLWQQMEAEYGIEIPRCSPGTPAVGSLRAKAGTGAPGFLSGTLVAEDDAVASVIEYAPEYDDRETEEDVFTDAAKRDLEASREFRKQMEARLATFRAGELDLEKSTSSRCYPFDVEAEADVARLAQLRLEVENLRAKAEAPGVSRVTDTDNTSKNDSIDTELAEPPLNALHDWMDDVWASSVGISSNDPGETRRAIASPQRGGSSGLLKRPPLPRSNPSSPTKKEMARLAEEKAMEWNESRYKGFSPRLKLGQHSPSKSPEKSKQIVNSARRLHEATVSPKASDPKPVQNSASIVEDQLDELLKELDEIDRIHDDVCMLANP